MTLNRKTRIAALIAALMFGAQAGIAALEEAASREPVEAAEEAPVEVAEAAEATAPEATAAVEHAAVAEPAPAAQVVETAQPTRAAKLKSWWDRFVAAIRSGQPVDLFQAQVESEWPLMPSQVAYFERLEQSRRHLVASGDPFPMGGRDDGFLMPSQIAYFDRLEQQRLASLQPQPEPGAGVQAASEESAQATGTGITMAQSTPSGTVQ